MKIKHVISAAVAGLAMSSCIVDFSNPDPLEPDVENESPYFVDISEPENSAVTGNNILLGRKHLLSFDSTVTVNVRHLDSSYACSGSNCVWQYRVEKDTVVSLLPSFQVIDTFRFSRTVHYSFFDTENDSCNARIELTDGHDMTIKPDSVWGDVHVRPGTHKTLSAVFNTAYSHLFYMYNPDGPITPSSFKTLLTLAQINDSGKLCMNTISGFASLGDTDMVVSDEDFFRMLSGTWKLKIAGVITSSVCHYATQDFEYEIRNDSLFGYPPSLPGSGCLFKNRTGWSGTIDNLDEYDAINRYFYFTLIGKDTLVAPLKVDRRMYATGFYIRDTSDASP